MFWDTAPDDTYLCSRLAESTISPRRRQGSENSQREHGAVAAARESLPGTLNR
jgi:hypothetical protein